MMNSGCIRRVLAILLCVLVAAPACAAAAYAADEPAFTTLSTYTESLNEGDVWFNSRALARDTGVEAYRNAAYSLSEDQNTLRIEYTVDGTPTTELRERDADAAYFAYLRVMPAFGDALPTSEDGLEPGAYWMDRDGLIESVSKYLPEAYMYMFTTSVFYLSADGTILRNVYTTPYGFASNSDELVTEDPGTLTNFLRQAGVDPNAGFTRLATADEGLSEGEIWFDLEAFARLFSGDTKTYILNADYYLSDDGDTLRIVMMGNATDFRRAEDAYYFTFLRTAGYDPNAGFTRLPTSDAGLEDGAYWYDAASLATAVGSEEVLTAEYSLSSDGNTLRIKIGTYATDISVSADYAWTYFQYLHQVGVDLLDGYLPVVYDEADVLCSGYVFRLADYIDDEIAQINAERVKHGDKPMTDDEETTKRAQIREELVGIALYYNPDASRICMREAGDYVIYAAGNKNYEQIISYVEFLETENHSWDGGKVTTEPTCLAAGERTFTCTRCGAVSTQPVDALGHSWDGGKVTTEPTCLAAGERTFTCTRCGATATEPVDALGHDYAAKITAATCTAGGFTTYTCTRCGDSRTGDETAALGHSFGAWTQTKAPTEYAEGEEARVCAVCGVRETRSVGRLPATELVIVTKPDAPLTYKDSFTLRASEAVTWSSSNEKVVKVDPATGKLTTVGKGTATITATSVEGGKTATCAVTVKYAWWQVLIRILLLGFLWY